MGGGEWGVGGARRGLGCLTFGSFHLDLFTTNKAWLVTSTSLASVTENFDDL